MSYAHVPLTHICTDDWGDLPREMPEFHDDVALHAGRNMADRNEALAVEQLAWSEDKIGSLPKAQLFYAGLNPVDFMRAFHDKHDDVEKIDQLISLDAEGNTEHLFFTKMGLHPQHINNQFSDKELENLCYERPGTQRWYIKRLAAKLGGDAASIPMEVIEAIQEVNIQKSLGRAHFRNYMRRVNKSIREKTGKDPLCVRKGKKKGKKFSVTRKDTDVSFS